MNSDLTSSETLDEERVRAVLGQLGHTVLEIGPGALGGNSRTYRARVASGDVFVKCYPDTEGGRKRFHRERVALSFMEQTGLDNVTRLVASSETDRIILLLFVPGERLAAADCTPDHIDQLVRFLLDLQERAPRSRPGVLPEASEASFSVKGLFETIEERLRVLDGVVGRDDSYSAMFSFMNEKLRPVLLELEQTHRSTKGYKGQVSWDRRILSPSDVGFHNVVRRPDGGLTFVDFEHFGWDDPAKLICDFCLHPHPRMNIGDDLRSRFVDSVSRGIEDPELMGRVSSLFPVFALKWSTILLNEFIDDASARRSLAGVSQDETSRLRQLSKAETMVQTATDGKFPYA